MYRAETTFAFPRVAEFLDQILSSLATHDMTVTPDASGFTIVAPFGEARLVPGKDELHMSVVTPEPESLNRLKHGLTGPINFIARSEGLHIVWNGDRTGPTLPPDLVMLQVKDIRQMTPRVRRITLIGSDVSRLDVDDQLHCRLMFQPIGVRRPQWPMLGDNGDVVWPGGEGRLASRIYTIRRIDAALQELDIDFFLHDRPGPATQWAMQASMHDIVGALGPAAHGPKPASWFVLAGDETGLPGIARILEGLPHSSQGVAFVEVSDETERQAIQAPAGIEVHWLYRKGAAPGTTTLLSDAVMRTEWPEPLDQAFFWGGCELGAFRAIRRYLKKSVGLSKGRQVSYPHWRRGMSEDDIIEAGGSAISE